MALLCSGFVVLGKPPKHGVLKKVPLQCEPIFFNRQQTMEFFLVGGAVRDELLNYPVHERDWVVVGGDIKTMIDRGFTPVGKDFPVFLHPDSKEEYALARTERKTGPGYKGFTVHASPEVTLAEDLSRRDLTINAMARSTSGALIDPFGGYTDLLERRLKHVSPAFAEDPVRILRTARFAARYHHLGFTIAEETYDLMRAMVASGEADALVAERVWKELSRALSEKNPEIFIKALRRCELLSKILPELDRLFGVPQDPKHHPEIDTGRHTLLCLKQACQLSTKIEVRFAVLMHDLGKGSTAQALLPKHPDHDLRGLPAIRTLCDRLAVPNHCRDLALLVCEFHIRCHRALTLEPAQLIEMLNRLDAFRRPERFAQFLLCCEADARGRQGFEHTPYPQRAFLTALRKKVAAIDAKPFIEQGVSGAALGDAINKARAEQAREFQREWQSTNT